MRFIVAIAIGLLACGLFGTGSGAAVSTQHSAVRHAPTLTRVVVATDFLPNVEFAPYYVAQDLGYYRAKGLNVVMNYDRVPDLMQAVGDGRYDFGIASGDTVVTGRAAGAPVTYVMAQYQTYPIGAMSLKSGGPALSSPRALKGKTIGISTPGSSTDIGLRALLRAGHLTEKDVKVTAIGFTETEALIDKQVDVAMTYIDNEPVQARALGHPVNVLPVSRYLKLISNGVVTSTKNVQQNPALVQRFVTATLRGLRYTLHHPNRAFAISMKRQPEIIDPKQREIQRQVLSARLKFQRPPAGHALGWSSPSAWKTTIGFLRSIGSIPRNARVQRIYTSIFDNAFARRARA